MTYKRSFSRLSLLSLFFVVLLAVCSCSNTPKQFTEPLDMEQFKAGTDRATIMRVVGQPESTAEQAGRQCDTYQLYTKGFAPDGWGGAGLPTQPAINQRRFSQADVRATQHTMLFCYTDHGQISDIYDKSPATSFQPVHRAFSSAFRVSNFGVTAATGVANPTDAQRVLQGMPFKKSTAQ